MAARTKAKKSLEQRVPGGSAGVNRRKTGRGYDWMVIRPDRTVEKGRADTQAAAWTEAREVLRNARKACES